MFRLLLHWLLAAFKIASMREACNFILTNCLHFPAATRKVKTTFVPKQLPDIFSKPEIQFHRPRRNFITFVLYGVRMPYGTTAAEMEKMRKKEVLNAPPFTGINLGHVTRNAP